MGRILISAGLLATILILAGCSWNTAEQERVSEFGIREEFICKIRALLDEEQFEELERIARDLSRTPCCAYYRPDNPHLFYQAMSGALHGGSETRVVVLPQLRRWMKAHPDSLTARIAYGKALVCHAWDAMEKDASGASDLERGRHFSARLKEAQAVLESAEALPARDPYLYVTWMDVAREQKWSRSDFERLFRKAIASAPYYPKLYMCKAVYLAFREDEEPAALKEYAEEAVALTRGLEGSSIYALIASDLAWYEQKLPFKKGLKWERAREGFEEILKNHPESENMRNRYASMAYSVGDREAGSVAFRELDFDPAFWKSEAEFDEARRWALKR